MMRICKTCGVQFEGSRDAIKCPACVAAVRATTIRPRVCKTCGVTFPGGPRASYCPDCREERKKAQTRDYHARKRVGKVREIGSTDTCTVCGKEYIVRSGLQRYCLDCAEEAIREKDREQSREWTAAHREERKTQEKAAVASIPCPICGTIFLPIYGRVTCSEECGVSLAKMRGREYQEDHRESLRERRNRNRDARIAAMTPEELQAYREKTNAAARENYRLRKEREGGSK